ncbi:hypothetical protein [Paraburkholderia sp. MM5477-R1]|uniref:hypothetical protein n=1 Tax=Paraburkholderia sp. MM5477-R1 TaxID=2991062 RepID=UPI003D21FAF3
MSPEQVHAMFSSVAMDFRIEMSMDDMLEGFCIWLSEARDRLKLGTEDFNTLCAIGGVMMRHCVRSGLDEPDEMEKIVRDLLEKYGKPLGES